MPPERSGSTILLCARLFTVTKSPAYNFPGRGFSLKADASQAASEARASFLRHEDQAHHSGKRAGEEAKIETGRQA